MNLADLKRAAEEEGVDVDSAPSQKVELTDGENYLVKPERVTQGLNQKGTLVYGAMFRILDGPDNVNRVYWDNWYISPKESAAGFNARTFAYLERIGVGMDVLLSVEGQYDDQANSLLTASANQAVNVEANYEPDKNDPEKVWPRFHYTAVTADSTLNVVADDDEDDELDF